MSKNISICSILLMMQIGDNNLMTNLEEMILENEWNRQTVSQQEVDQVIEGESLSVRAMITIV